MSDISNIFHEISEDLLTYSFDNIKPFNNRILFGFGYNTVCKKINRIINTFKYRHTINISREVDKRFYNAIF